MTLIDAPEGLWVGRCWRPDIEGPSVVTLRDGSVVDTTSSQAPTVSHLLDLADPVAHGRSVRDNGFPGTGS